MRLECVEQIEIAIAELGAAPRPPDTQVTEIARAVEDEHVDAVVQSVARQKVVVEFDSLQSSRAE